MESVRSGLGALQAERVHRLGVGGFLGARASPASKGGSEASTWMALGTRTVGAARGAEATRDGDIDRRSPRR